MKDCEANKKWREGCRSYTCQPDGKQVVFLSFLFSSFCLFFLLFFFGGKQVVWDDLECRHGVERNRDKKDCEANKEWKEKGCNLCRCHSDGKEVVCLNQCTSQGAMHCSEDGNGDEVCRYNEPPPKRRVYRP